MKIKLALAIIAFSTSILSFSQEPDWEKLYKESQKTEVYEPVPPKVDAGKCYGEPPSDAVVLFDGTDLEKWTYDNPENSETWKVENGIMTVNKKAGSLTTRDSYLDYQLHLEYLIPENITGEGQSRGNSGIFLAYLGLDETGLFEDGYEIQILDNYDNDTYVNGQVGSMYKQSIPLANAARKPGEWQTYDIVWKGPRFNEDGTLKSAASVTAFHNGVLVQNNYELKGITPWIGPPSYRKHGPSPIRLQAHGDPSEPISFRNIWLREL
ncbi:3-keto-disaccharide hydrolase [Maribacter flavus]|uniref:3-keto-disaccharide hydrolase n=1 Tax=Maribacter flavus TaxID=1658664 RepID=UPI001B8673FE|nr:DUF1080 domain-containing protein [Maribacter flavus]